MKNKIDRPKLFMDIAKDNYVLVREDDGKRIPCSVIKFIEWKEDGTFKAVHDEPAVGRSIVVDPGPYGQFRWMTSAIAEVIDSKHIKTNNSTYKIYEV